MDENFIQKADIISDNVKSLYELEKHKNNKDDILIIYISLARYLLDKGVYDKSLNLLSFVEEKINKTLRFYEEALYLKMQIFDRLKNKDEFEKTADKIKIFPEYLYRKYSFLIDFYFENGEKEKVEKVLKEYENLVKYDSLYKFLDFKLISFDLLYRTAKYNDLIDQINEIENNELKQCLSFDTPYSILKGLAYYAKENFTEALNTLIKSSEYFKKGGFQSQLLGVYNNIGEIYKLFKKYDSANAIYEKILSTSRYLGDKDAEAVATWNIGESYFFTKDYQKAEEYFTEGEKLFFEAGTYERYENYLKIFFAKLYIETSRIDSAEGLIDEVLMSAFEREEMKEYADALTLKGYILGNKGEDVTHYFDEAIGIYKNLGAKIELKEAEKLKITYSKK